MGYDEHGNEIKSSGSEGFIMINFSNLKDGFSNGVSADNSGDGNDNGVSGNAGRTWAERVKGLPKGDGIVMPLSGPSATGHDESVPLSGEALRIDLLEGEELRIEKMVQATILHMDVVDLAKQRRSDRDKPEFKPAPMVSFSDLAKRPIVLPEYTVEQLWPEGSNVLFAAAAKTGKSTVVANLIRAMMDGSAFLGTFETKRVPADETILLVDFEMSESRVVSELVGQGFRDQDLGRLWVSCLRGSAQSFDFRDEEARADLVARCIERNVKTLILDPLAPLLGYLNVEENDNTLVNQFFQQLDSFKKDAGIRDMIVVHHCGHSADMRPRGASRFNDWPDALWLAKIDGPVDDPASPRKFYARGRDVGEELNGPGVLKRDTTNPKVIFFEANGGASQAEIDAVGRIENWIFGNQGKTRREIMNWCSEVINTTTGETRIDFGANKIDEFLKGLTDSGRAHKCRFKKVGGAGAPSDYYYSDPNRCGNTACPDRD